MTLDALAREMKGTRVLGAGRIGEAVDVVTEMFRDRSYTNFLTIAGPMVPAGFRLLFGDLIDRGFLDAIVTTGANLTHDVIESLGLHHYQGSFQVDDRKLIQRGYSRIADIFVTSLKGFSCNVSVCAKLQRLSPSIESNSPGENIFTFLCAALWRIES